MTITERAWDDTSFSLLIMSSEANVSNHDEQFSGLILERDETAMGRRGHFRRVGVAIRNPAKYIDILLNLARNGRLASEDDYQHFDPEKGYTIEIV